MQTEICDAANQWNQPIGQKALDTVLRIGDGLFALGKDRFEPNEGVYSLCDCGNYVSAFDFESFWANYPAWMLDAWMLADNGQYTSDDVAAMTILDIFRAYNSPDFNPEFAFYTMADENGEI